MPGSGAPYVVHLAKVAMETMSACAADPKLDADLAITCALLHDAIEDAGVDRAELEQRFGARVAAGVQALTKNASLPKEQQMRDALDRIRTEPREIWVVKLADRITNLEPPPPHWSPEKCRKYHTEAQVIFTALQGVSALLDARIAQKIAEYLR